MILAHRIRLVPTNEQEAYFLRACGVARFAYNWALAEWQRAFEAGEKPSEVALRKRLNALKGEQFPWMCEVTKNAPQQAIKNLGRAYANFFDDLKKYRRNAMPWKRVRVPKFKKKGRHDGFRADNGPDKLHPDAVQTIGKRVKLPIIGWVAMRSNDSRGRFPANGEVRRIVPKREPSSHDCIGGLPTFAPTSCINLPHR